VQFSTHPSHPAVSAILSTLSEAQKWYADMRGNWSVKYLEGPKLAMIMMPENIKPLLENVKEVHANLRECVVAI